MGIVLLTDNEKSEVEWWARHHKGNVAYLAEKIKELVDNPDDEEIRKFFYSHFKATIDDFLATTHPRWCPHTKKWEDEESAEEVH
tara:strand:- start:4004 stop:4258 length:255 start_codon:yes stop_codon:yes gene_type:complete